MALTTFKIRTLEEQMNRSCCCQSRLSIAHLAPLFHVLGRLVPPGFLGKHVFGENWAILGAFVPLADCLNSGPRLRTHLIPVRHLAFRQLDFDFEAGQVAGRFCLEQRSIRAIFINSED